MNQLGPAMTIFSGLFLRQVDGHEVDFQKMRRLSPRLSYKFFNLLHGAEINGFYNKQGFKPFIHPFLRITKKLFDTFIN